ncbi:chaperone protein dnaJ 20, chloroplastic-like [Coffea eugenioides]|uniref:chaperone protein dnaJ 20, chloroplastic-like n=1 Tax=Coffea eugenioides TaxID=49369 RepID=UPI000F60BF48|nr:chaperone protein dnaJ 20, chloroplastic-like [Coffea eugenioides]
MEASLQISGISTRFGKTVQFNQKGSCKEKFLQHRTVISWQAARTVQTGRAANFYEVLSLDCSKFVGLDEIKKAYRCKALKFHPDSCPPSEKEESTRRFLELRMAYETLSDPISRELYDHELSLVDVDGRTRHGMSCSMGSKVWERQIAELNKRSRQKMEKRKEMGMWN